MYALWLLFCKAEGCILFLFYLYLRRKSLAIYLGGGALDAPKNKRLIIRFII